MKIDMPDEPPKQIASTGANSAFLGLGVIGAIFGFAMLFTTNEDPSLTYKAGASAGQVVAVAAVSLPIFLVWRFGTTHGRRQDLGVAFNAFTGVCALLWLVLFGFAKSYLPSVIGTAKAPTANQIAGKVAESSEYRAYATAATSHFADLTQGKLFGIQIGDTIQIVDDDKTGDTPHLA